jgi:selenide,water dikinase
VTIPPRGEQQRIVLVGAGNAHIQIVRRWSMARRTDAALTLLTDQYVVPYSAMVPGYLSGRYERSEIEIDLVRLCVVAGVRLVRGTLVGLDRLSRRITVEDHGPLEYDLLSLNLGSQPRVPEYLASFARVMVSKPLGLLIDQLEQLESGARIVVVGGGGGGFELALALRQRFSAKDTSITIVGPRLLAAQGRAGAYAEAALRKAGVSWVVGEVVGGDRGCLALNQGGTLAADVVIWAVEGSPQSVTKELALACDEAGFIRIRRTLQTLSDPRIFAVGDCAAFPDKIPRAGVFAVRQGPVLWCNLTRALKNQKLKLFRPQSRFLTLFDTADGEAIASRGGWAIKGRAVRALKLYIDRRWHRRFQLTAMAESAEHPMPCGGCGSKVSQSALLASLAEGPHGNEPSDVVLGMAHREDAAWVTSPRGEAQLLTVDAFRPFLDEPYLFARISVANALSDIYAMNGIPRFMMASVVIPYGSLAGPRRELTEIVTGIRRAVSEHGVHLVGGHTTFGPELSLSLSVVGYLGDRVPFRKAAFAIGDRLILTKPIGTGALLRAQMRGRCEGRWFEALIESMLRSNAQAAAIFSEAGVIAATDITGFGLGGHLLEALELSGRAATLDASAIPRLPGFDQVSAEGFRSTLYAANAEAQKWFHADAEAWPALFDPQTSGGLLGAVPVARVAATLARLRAAGYASASVVGEVTAYGPAGSPRVLIEKKL